MSDDSSQPSNGTDINKNDTLKSQAATPKPFCKLPPPRGTAARPTTEAGVDPAVLKKLLQIDPPPQSSDAEVKRLLAGLQQNDPEVLKEVQQYFFPDTGSPST